MQGANRAAHRAVPGHQLDEAAAPMDADEAHVLLHAGQVEHAAPRACRRVRASGAGGLTRVHRA